MQVKNEYGAGRVFKRGKRWGYSLYIGGREVRHMVGRSKVAAETELAEARLVKADPSLAQKIIDDYQNIVLKKAKKVPSITYVLQDETNGEIKIGTSTNLKKRIRDISGRHPHACTFIGILPIAEREAHIRLYSSRLNGEWFYPSRIVKKFLKTYGLEIIKPARRLNPRERLLTEKLKLLVDIMKTWRDKAKEGLENEKVYWELPVPQADFLEG